MQLKRFNKKKRMLHIVGNQPSGAQELHDGHDYGGHDYEGDYDGDFDDDDEYDDYDGDFDDDVEYDDYDGDCDDDDPGCKLLPLAIGQPGPVSQTSQPSETFILI